MYFARPPHCLWPLVVTLLLTAGSGCHAPKPTWNNTFGGSATLVPPPGTGSYTAGKGYYSGSSATPPLSSTRATSAGDTVAAGASSETTWQGASAVSRASAQTEQPVGSSVATTSSLRLQGMPATELAADPQTPREMPTDSPGLLPLPALPESNADANETTPPSAGGGQWRKR